MNKIRQFPAERIFNPHFNKELKRLSLENIETSTIKTYRIHVNCKHYTGTDLSKLEFKACNEYQLWKFLERYLFLKGQNSDGSRYNLYSYHLMKAIYNNEVTSCNKISTESLIKLLMKMFKENTSTIWYSIINEEDVYPDLVCDISFL